MKQKTSPNVIPLCDILLVLLIIFLVLTPMAQLGMDLNLPEKEGKSGPAIVVTVGLDGIIQVNKQPFYSLEQVEKRLKEIFSTRENKILFLKAHDKLSYNDVVKVIDLVWGVGIDKIYVIPSHYR